MDGTVHIVNLDQKPCFVHYLEHYNKFLVGTYELFQSIDDARCKLNSRLSDQQLTKELDKINQRAGKLILLRGNDISAPSIEYEFDCEAGGGLFDAKVRFCSIDSSYSIYVAHSNGSIGIYKLALQCGNKICLREFIKVNGSTMLTTIDLVCEKDGSTERSQQLPSSTSPSSSGPSTNVATITTTPTTTNQAISTPPSSSSISHRTQVANIPAANVNRLVVGDSEGFVAIILKGTQIRQDIASGDSIWQVKSIRLTLGQYVTIVGAENSSWYVLGFDEAGGKLNVLYTNSCKDFGAGITSISMLNINHYGEHDLVELLLGSYDETIQTYHVKLKQDGLSRPDVCHKDTMTIAGGGIWRIKAHRGRARRQLCVAAMYAGAYLLDLDQQVDSELFKTKLVDTKTLKLDYKPLHYDVDVSTFGTTYCIVDFNNSLCLFKTI